MRAVCVCAYSLYGTLVTHITTFDSMKQTLVYRHHVWCAYVWVCVGTKRKTFIPITFHAESLEAPDVNALTQRIRVNIQVCGAHP